MTDQDLSERAFVWDLCLVHRVDVQLVPSIRNLPIRRDFPFRMLVVVGMLVLVLMLMDRDSADHPRRFHSMGGMSVCSGSAFQIVPVVVVAYYARGF